MRDDSDGDDGDDDGRWMVLMMVDGGELMMVDMIDGR